MGPCETRIRSDATGLSSCLSAVRRTRCFVLKAQYVKERSSFRGSLRSCSRRTSFRMRRPPSCCVVTPDNKKPGLVRTGFVAMVMVHIIDRNTGSCWYQRVAAWAWHSLSARSLCDTALMYVVSFRSFFFHEMKSPGCWPGRCKGSLCSATLQGRPGSVLDPWSVVGRYVCSFRIWTRRRGHPGAGCLCDENKFWMGMLMNNSTQ